jgi:sRNA-binding protein
VDEFPVDVGQAALDAVVVEIGRWEPALRKMSGEDVVDEFAVDVGQAALDAVVVEIGRWEPALRECQVRISWMSSPWTLVRRRWMPLW